MFNVCGIYRDNSDYLTRHFIDQLNEAIDKFNNIHCYFYENDSTDNTSELLLTRLKTHPTVLFERSCKPKIAREETNKRIEHLSYCRNRLLSLRPFTPSNEWTIFVDSDIYFDGHQCVGSLTALLELFLSRTYNNEVVGVCCNGKHSRECQLHTTDQHKCFQYYDTYPLVYTDDTWVHREMSARSPFTCNWWFLQRENFMRFKHGEPVKVNSAFGGLSFYKTDVINKLTMCYKPTLWKNTQHVMSEHVGFNEALREHGDLVVDPALIVFNKEG